MGLSLFSRHRGKTCSRSAYKINKKDTFLCLLSMINPRRRPGQASQFVQMPTVPASYKSFFAHRNTARPDSQKSKFKHNLPFAIIKCYKPSNQTFEVSTCVWLLCQMTKHNQPFVHTVISVVYIPQWLCLNTIFSWLPIPICRQSLQHIPMIQHKLFSPS